MAELSAKTQANIAQAEREKEIVMQQGEQAHEYAMQQVQQENQQEMMEGGQDGEVQQSGSQGGQQSEVQPSQASAGSIHVGLRAGARFGVGVWQAQERDDRRNSDPSAAASRIEGAQ